MATEKQGMTTAEFAAGMFELDGATEHKNIMVFGDSGCGKTVLAGTCPGRLLILAGEPGYISAARQRSRLLDAALRSGKSKVRIIPDTATALAGISWLEDGGYQQFDWVIPDGLGTIQNKALLSYAAEAWDANPAKRVHRNLPDKPDYFNAQNFIKGWVSRLIDLPVNTLFTAHAMRPEDKASGDMVVYPAIQGKGYEISNYVAGLMHCVGFMSPVIVGKGDEARQARRILWQQYRSDDGTLYFAKDQFDALGRWTDDLTMPQLLELIDNADAGQSRQAVAAEAPAEDTTRRRPPARKAARARQRA